MLDDAAYGVLWDIFDATGSVRPEYLLPTLQIESGLNPDVPNQQGYDYWGINQISGKTLRAQGIDPHDYLTWPASEQLRRIVMGYMQAQVKAYGPLRSGTRVYQANLYPASLKTAKTLDAVIFTAPARPCVPKDTNPYCANKGLDVGQKGTITVGDIAIFVGHAAGYAPVKDALAKTYALRPDERMRDPVYGDDFDLGGKLLPMPTATNWALALGGAAALLGASVAIAYAVKGAPAGGRRASDFSYDDIAEENPVRRRRRESMHVQTLLFPRDRFTVAKAKAWARGHDFASRKVDVPEGGQYIRLRQEAPLKGGVKRMITLSPEEGIKAVVQRPA